MNVIKMCYTAHNRRSYWSVRYDSLELHISKIKIVNKRFYSHLLSKSIREKTSTESKSLASCMLWNEVGYCCVLSDIRDEIQKQETIQV